MNDFDFLVGVWDVSNRWRKDFIDESAEWMDEFPSVLTSSSHLGDLANFSECIYPTRGFSAITLRFYDPKTELWSDYWASQRHPGVMAAPVVGRIENGHGEFYGDDVQDGVPVKVRFIWSNVTRNSAEWEQAMSVDTGKTWITNWTSTLRRRQ
ncbi:hypothetical protein AB0E08_35590 [Streptomyces sp. NPDC048281]|uniref:hypothetical protein n=1 Tax=Streptomyces sp. NPDC048281 TaxID=3154715 RepID=UPI00342D90D9